MNYPELCFTPEAEPADMVAALEKAGCIRIAGLFPRQKLQVLQDWAESAFAQFDQQLIDGTLDPALQDYFALLPHMVNHIPSIAFDCFQGQTAWLWELFRETTLPHFLHCFYHGTFLYSSLHAVIRRQRPDLPRWFTGFHQDGHFLNPAWRMLHCWSPLVACGQDAPSLELIPAGLKAIRPSHHKPWRGEHYYDNRDLDLESEILPYFPVETFWPQILEPGDALIYDSYCLHRTYVLPSMSKPRYNLEMRFIPDVPLPPSIARLGFLRV